MITEELTKPNDSEVQSGTKTLSGTRSTQPRQKKVLTEQPTNEVTATPTQETSSTNKADTVIKSIEVDQIKIDGGTQIRVKIDQDYVKELADFLDDDIVNKFKEDIVVFFDGIDYWLADGFHRYHAYKKTGRSIVNAEVCTGTKRDAVKYALSANETHGLRRTNEDKRKAVETALTDKEWCQWSDREIAKLCAVGRDLVGAIRKKVTVGNDSEKSKTRIYTNKHGKQGSMDTSKISGKVGKGGKKSKSEVQPKANAESPVTPPVIEVLESPADASGTDREQDAQETVLNYIHEIESLAKVLEKAWNNKNFWNIPEVGKIYDDIGFHTACLYLVARKAYGDSDVAEQHKFFMSLWNKKDVQKPHREEIPIDIPHTTLRLALLPSLDQILKDTADVADKKEEEYENIETNRH